MSKEYRVLPECYGDTLLIDILGFKNPNHQFGISVVAQVMLDKFSNRLAIGVVDDDKKNHPKYFSEFELIEEKDNLILKKHPDKKHYLIFFCPAFETWIWNHSNDLGVDPTRFNIRDFKRFKTLTKSQNVHENENIKQFLNALKQKKGSPLKTIISWLNEYLGE
jgi:hypothetical protein